MQSKFYFENDDEVSMRLREKSECWVIRAYIGCLMFCPCIVNGVMWCCDTSGASGSPQEIIQLRLVDPLHLSGFF